ncbi:MAG: nickel pincer cofactor biosynthesis protein LarC [Nitrospirae bacterium]|nr:nickel pincer cofactor biosynthesis protein LarC [Nitrospirota bacterium]
MAENKTMKIAYFDCFSGISGDMCLGALIDAGVPLEKLTSRLQKLHLPGYSISQKKVTRCGIAATRAEVLLKGKQTQERKWADISKIIVGSGLSSGLKRKGLSVFRSLFEAEASVHGGQFEEIHLHELGAVDCIVDIFGTLIGLDLLGVDKIYASALNLGSGSVRTSHGLLPVPAPATLELLRGVPVYSSGGSFEMTTPTGAALIKSISADFGAMPLFIPEKTGHGAGGKDPDSMPNILRVTVGSMSAPPADGPLVVVETNIDDMNPQVYEHVVGLLLKAGALDAWLTQIMMKKMRPAVKLSVLTVRGRLDEISEILLRETTSLGVRYYDVSRNIMERRIDHVKTPAGKIGVKVSIYKNRILKVTPEYEDCRRVSEKSGLPLIEVLESARTAAARLIKKTGKGK